MSETLLKKASAYLELGPGLKHSGTGLQNILAKVKQLEEYNQRFSALLDPHLKKYCHVANISQNTIIVIAANGSVATQLRLQTNTLLRKFAQDPLLQKVQNIHCKVRPFFSFETKEQKHPQKMRLLSPEHAKIIREMAETLEDPNLREIMLRIASRLG